MISHSYSFLLKVNLVSNTSTARSCKAHTSHLAFGFMTTSLWGASCSLSSVKAWVKVCMIRDLPQRPGPWAFQSSAAKRDLKIIGKPWENHEKTMRKPRKISETCEDVWETYGKHMGNWWKFIRKSWEKTIDYGNYGHVLGSWDLNGHQYDRDVKFY